MAFRVEGLLAATGWLGLSFSSAALSPRPFPVHRCRSSCGNANGSGVPDMESQEFDDEMNDDDIEPEAQQDDESPRALRRAAAAGKKAKAEADSLRRENAMLKAGVDTTSPVGQLFLDGYKGDVDPEAVKAAWAAVAPVAAVVLDDAPTETETPELTDDEKSSTGQRQALAANSPADELQDIDPRVDALAVHANVLAKGGTNDDAQAALFERTMQAALAGDERVLVPRRRD